MNDRRPERTKQTIYDAMIKLLHEKEFAQISVRDITEQANINRSTFYRHFVDKYELIEYLVKLHTEKIDDLIYELFCQPTEKLILEDFKKILKYIEEDKEFYTLMLSNKHNTPYFRPYLIELIQDGLKRSNPSKFSPELEHSEFNLYFFSSCTLSLFEWWIAKDCSVSITEIQDYLQHTLDEMIFHFKKGKAT